MTQQEIDQYILNTPMMGKGIQSNMQMPDMSSVVKPVEVQQPQTPKGGGFMQGAGLSAIGGAIEGIGQSLSPQRKINEEFLQRNRNLQKELATEDQLTSIGTNVASKFGPWGMLAAAGLQAGSALTKGSTDEFGVIEDKGKFIAGAILNPNALLTAAKQGERKTARNRFINREMSENITENQRVGNQISNSIPRYTSPGYGRAGMKLTKFSKNVT